jgi:hypothetical protein
VNAAASLVILGEYGIKARSPNPNKIDHEENRTIALNHGGSLSGLKRKGFDLVARQNKFERMKQARAYQLVRTGLLHLKMPSRCSGGEELPFAPVAEWSGRKKARQDGPVGERRDAAGPGWAVQRLGPRFPSSPRLSLRPNRLRGAIPGDLFSLPRGRSGSTATALRRHSFGLEVLGKGNMRKHQLSETNSVLFHPSIHNNLKMLVGFYLKAANNSCPWS